MTTEKKLEKECLGKLGEIAEYSESLLDKARILESHILSILIGNLAGDENPDALYLFKLTIDNTKDPETLNPAGPNNSNTVLHNAASSNLLEAYKMIMDKVKDKNPSNSIGCTPLHFAARNGHLRICELIVKEIKDLNPRIHQGRYEGALNPKIHQGMYQGDTPHHNFLQSNSS